jgi:hypothetical protein
VEATDVRRAGRWSPTSQVFTSTYVAKHSPEDTRSLQAIAANDLEPPIDWTEGHRQRQLSQLAEVGLAGRVAQIRKWLAGCETSPDPSAIPPSDGRKLPAPLTRVPPFPLHSLVDYAFLRDTAIRKLLLPVQTRREGRFVAVDFIELSGGAVPLRASPSIFIGEVHYDRKACGPPRILYSHKVGTDELILPLVDGDGDPATLSSKLPTPDAGVLRIWTCDDPYRALSRTRDARRRPVTLLDLQPIALLDEPVPEEPEPQPRPLSFAEARREIEALLAPRKPSFEELRASIRNLCK